ncbi:MAG: HPr family phosphocarrier protein [Thermodesulfobacteriota bacterium]|nr:HPr family phosphocarrier protein [Thermodesulfobacteriota bacterium]
MVSPENTDGIEISETFTIINKLGVHVRPATQLVKTANTFDSDIYIKKDDLEVDGKSIMGVLMLAASHGSKIIIRADGKDAKEAIGELGRLIIGKFGEE